MIRIQEKLPKKLLNKLKVCDGVTIMKGDYSLLDLRESEVGKQIYREWLTTEVDVDPLVMPNFTNPYVRAELQGEVHGLLETYRTLTVTPSFNFPDFALGEAPFYQYHHSAIALHMVQTEIENPTQYIANCPLLAGLANGH